MNIKIDHIHDNHIDDQFYCENAKMLIPISPLVFDNFTVTCIFRFN